MTAALALPARIQTHDQVVTSLGSRPFRTPAHPGLSVAGSPVAGMTVQVP